MKILNGLIGALLALLSGVALAQETESPAASGPVARAGWYVAPAFTYMKPDSGRCNVNDGLGASVMFGHRGDFASIELWGQYLQADHDGCRYTVPDGADMDSNRDQVTEPSGTVSLNGGGIGLLLGPFFEDKVLQRFFGIVGFGVIRREDHPQYAQGDTTIFGDAGIGYMHPLPLFGLASSLRADLRYRYDVQQPPHPDEQNPAPAHNYSDIILNVGLQFALSKEPEPVAVAPAPPEAVAVVAVADADADGVPDDKDTCPETAAGTAVNETGCVPAPEPSPAVTIETAKAGDTIVLHGVNFETGRATLTTNARTILDQVAEKVVARAQLNLEIGGHTDSRGSNSYNQSLSEQRAQSVMSYLIEKGVDAGRLTSVGYGEDQPVDSNETDEGRERNRRVELKILDQAPAAPAEPPATPPAQ